MKNVFAIELAKAELGIEEEIHTFAEWKRLGFSVKKGEKACCKISIWNRATRKQEDDEPTDDGYFYTKMASFFKASQVQPTEE